MSVEDVGRSKPGRRRDPACDDAIHTATLDELVERGYAGLSIEGVAARAGVGKATIYRRYQSKAQLVVDAVRVGARFDDLLPDTGDVRADLTSMLHAMIARLVGPDGKLLITFAAERVRFPELAAEFDRSVIGDKRRHMHAVLRAAIERGELSADADVELLAEVGPALVWHHALYGLPMDAELPERIIAVVLASARSASHAPRAQSVA
jgi:AcrR family transcriptional regulator